MRLLMVSPDSFFPKEWAALLVEHFCDSTDLSSVKTDWRDWLAPIQQKWYEQVEEKVRERNIFYLTNPFNAKESAASTFIGIEFGEDNTEWEAMIVGDSCLFHQTDSEFKSYLIENSVGFTDNVPSFSLVLRKTITLNRHLYMVTLIPVIPLSWQRML